MDVGFDQMFLLIVEEHEAGYYKLANDRCQYLLTKPNLNDEQKAALWNRMGLARNRLFGMPHGLDAYSKAAYLNPNAWVYYYNVGVTHLWSTHRFEEAEKALEAAARLATFDMGAQYRYGEALAKNGKSSESKANFSRAFDLAKQAFENRPSDPDARLYFRYSCDMLGLEYPENLKSALLDPEPEDIDNMRPSSLDQGDIVRSERNGE
jgi:tetratricopeptide (TPR) repeat protein